MAEPALTRQILLGLQSRLQTVRIAAGYHTDAGLDVRVEESQGACTAPFLSLWTASVVRSDDGRVASERELTVIIEGQLPVLMTNAHERLELMADDIERSLDGFRPPAATLPMQFRETVFLDRPDGLPVMACQCLFATRYRR